MAEKNVQRVRVAVQWGFLLFSLYLGVTFYRFVQYFRTGGVTPFVARPDGVEAPALAETQYLVDAVLRENDRLMATPSGRTRGLRADLIWTIDLFTTLEDRGRPARSTR